MARRIFGRLRRRRPRSEPMPARFYRLELYNEERNRGIVHTPEYRQRMEELQRDFDAWMVEDLRRQGVRIVGDEGRAP